jgi:hypothetical protein
VLSATPSPRRCQPPPPVPPVIQPPPLIVLSATHLLFYLIVVIGLAETEHGHWPDVLRCPPLSSHRVISRLLASCLVVPPLACFIFWLLCVGWVSPLEIDTTPDEFLPLVPLPSIFFYSVTKKYDLSSRHKIVPKNCTSFFLVTEWGSSATTINQSSFPCFLIFKKL